MFCNIKFCTFEGSLRDRKIMDYLNKIKSISKEIGLDLQISGSIKTKIFYGKTLQNPCKIITGNNSFLFLQLFSKLIEFNDCTYYNEIGGYTAIFTRDNFKFEIQSNCNGFDTICVYKNN